MNNEYINIYDNVEALCKAFTSILKEELDKKDKVNIALSGGTTPKSIFNYWVESCKTSIDWERVVFYWGDERCVPPDNEMSNFGMTKALLFDKIDAIHPTNIHRIHGESEPLEESVWYDGILDHLAPSVDNIPYFDIMMLGMGDDGHTVSIFPNQIGLWDSPQNCVVAEHPESGMKRISLTGRVVNNAANVVFLVTGKNKAEKVREVVKDRISFFDIYPAARVNPVYGKLFWVLDKEAGSML